MAPIGRIRRIPLRELWPNEERDFTPWLLENIQQLAEELDVSLSNPRREQAAGCFYVDLVADKGSGLAIIENQYERSDHDHLGKLVTYAAIYAATTVIWIVEHGKDEHLQAISWLNNLPGVDFYLVQAEAISIEGSVPALLFTKLFAPSKEIKRAKAVQEDMRARQRSLYEFWSELIERAKSTRALHGSSSPSKENWIRVSAGKPGLGYVHVANNDWARVELYIDYGRNRDALNRAAFQYFYSHRNEIDQAFGVPLTWDIKEGRRGQRISFQIDGLGGWDTDPSG
jgi:hypothetical protein